MPILEQCTLKAYCRKPLLSSTYASAIVGPSLSSRVLIEAGLTTVIDWTIYDDIAFGFTRGIARMFPTACSARQLPYTPYSMLFFDYKPFAECPALPLSAYIHSVQFYT